jgi:hypothetical protein
MATKIDAMNLAKEMQVLSEKEKDFFMHELFRLENSRQNYIKGGRYREEYLLSKSMLVSTLTEKLGKKQPKTDLKIKRKAVEDGIRAYMEFTSPDTVIKFFDTLFLTPKIITKASAKKINGYRRPTRVYE